MCIVEFTGHLLSDRDTTSCTGMGEGVNGNNQWEWEGMGLKKIFSLISSSGWSALSLCSGVEHVALFVVFGGKLKARLLD